MLDMVLSILNWRVPLWLFVLVGLLDNLLDTWWSRKVDSRLEALEARVQEPKARVND